MKTIEVIRDKICNVELNYCLNDFQKSVINCLYQGASLAQKTTNTALKYLNEHPAHIAYLAANLSSISFLSSGFLSLPTAGFLTASMIALYLSKIRGKKLNPEQNNLCFARREFITQNDLNYAYNAKSILFYLVSFGAFNSLAGFSAKGPLAFILNLIGYIATSSNEKPIAHITCKPAVVKYHVNTF